MAAMTSQEMQNTLNNEFAALSGDAIFDKWKQEADGVLLWLARMPVDNIFPRQSVTGEVMARRPGEVLTVNLEEKVPEIFRKLVLEGFLSSPVVDEQGKYHGFIDMLDLVVYTLKTFAEWRSHATTATTTADAKTTANPSDKTPPPTSTPTDGPAAAASSSSASSSTSGSEEQIWNEFMKLNEFRKATVKDAMRNEANAYNPQHAIYRGFSLFHAVELMARTMAHRVAVTDKNGVVTGILTQSMTISLLDQNMESRFPTISSVPVSILMPGLYKTVELIHENDPAIEAFKKMVTFNVSGLPVVNSAGHLVDNISVRDLRGIGTDSSKWLRLWDPVRKYKDNVRAEYSSQTPDRPIFVTPDDTLATVLRRMYDGNIHRVYVANIGRASNGEMVPLAPLHVISQRDILRFVLFLTLRLRSVKRLTRWWKGQHTHDWEAEQEDEEHGGASGQNEATIDLAQATSAQQALEQVTAAENEGKTAESK